MDESTTTERSHEERVQASLYWITGLLVVIVLLLGVIVFGAVDISVTPAD